MAGSESEFHRELPGESQPEPVDDEPAGSGSRKADPEVVAGEQPSVNLGNNKGALTERQSVCDVEATCSPTPWDALCLCPLSSE